jgi:hypothetical protein
MSVDNPRRIGQAPIALSAAESQLIGEQLCGPGHFHADRHSIQCPTCPPFTGDAGDAEEWTLSSPLRIRLSADDRELLLFDTDGCEPHFQELGGALLLRISTKRAGSRLERLFYRPGFRLDDCLRAPQAHQPTLLVCNEEFLAQGEITGHLSVMHVARSGITRWRLLRWYDNSGVDSQEVLRIVPTAATVIEDKDAGTLLQVDMDVTDIPRTRFESDPKVVTEHLIVRFERAGDRLIPDPVAKKTLKRLEKRMARFLDE